MTCYTPTALRCHGAGIAALAVLQSFAKQIFDVIDLLTQQIELACEPLDLDLGTAVDLIVELTPQSILCVLSVLTHHDHWCLNGGQHGEEQVEQDERIGIPGRAVQEYIGSGV